MTDFDLNESQEHDVADERHRASCGACAGAWADLERISAEARALPVLTPSRDLWGGIEARITDAPQRDLERRRRIATIARLATAASLLVAATATITWNLATRAAGAANPLQFATEAATASAPQPDLGVAFGTPTSAAGEVQQASLDNTTRAMDREIAELQALVDDRRESFDPRTIAVLEANLRMIDAAIDESRKALAADPASRFLAAQYTRAYTSKLTLLRGAVTLPAGD